jgi:hypothetical protein
MSFSSPGQFTSNPGNLSAFIDGTEVLGTTTYGTPGGGIDNLNVGPTAPQFQSLSFIEMATTATTAQSMSGWNSFYVNAVTDISVSAVLEPAAYWLMLTGMPALAYVSRRTAHSKRPKRHRRHSTRASPPERLHLSDAGLIISAIEVLRLSIECWCIAGGTGRRSKYTNGHMGLDGARPQCERAGARLIDTPRIGGRAGSNARHNATGIHLNNNVRLANE